MPQGFDMKDMDEVKPPNLNWDLWLGPAESTKYTSQLHPFNWRAGGLEKSWSRYGLPHFRCTIQNSWFTLSNRC